MRLYESDTIIRFPHIYLIINPFGGIYFRKSIKWSIDTGKHRPNNCKPTTVLCAVHPYWIVSGNIMPLS